MYVEPKVYSLFVRSTLMAFVFCDLIFTELCLCSEEEVDSHLEIGKKLLAAGQLADALTHYHAAVELDPNNYQIYFRRAAVYMAIGKSKSALPDLNKAIKLQPDFGAAYQQRGSVHLKAGRLSMAKSDFEKSLRLDPSNAESQKMLNLIPSAADYVENARNLYDNHMFSEAIEFLTKALEICPFDIELRSLRANSYEQVNEGFKAASDFKYVNRLSTDNTNGYLRVSQLLYKLGDPEQSLTEIRSCLKLDPDHKECFKHYKKIKKIFRAFDAMQRSIDERSWDQCLQKLQKLEKMAQDSEGVSRQIESNRCLCGAKLGNDDAVEACNHVLVIYPGNTDALCNRAEAYIHKEMLNEAITDYQKVLEADKNNQRAKDGIERAQKLLKASRKRNYYKILGVQRNARKREILRAYRKLAAKYHPDHYKGDDKATAKRKFIDISDAKEVLTDEENRRKFDAGIDPLESEQNSAQSWHHEFHPHSPNFQHYFSEAEFQFHFR